MESEVFLAIVVIGVFTYLFRVVLFFKLPKFTENKYVKAGMDSISATMLIALVVPFTIIYNNKIEVFRNEVYAILITILIVWKTKKPNFALLIALGIYLILSIIID